MAGTQPWTLLPRLLLLYSLLLLPLPSWDLPGARAALVTAARRPPEAASTAAGRGGGPPVASVEGGGAAGRSSPLRVAQCRARCLQRFSGGSSSKDAVCMQAPDCFVCWENCELLQSNYAVWGRMCKQKSICFPGCQQACKFHRERERGEGAAGDVGRQNGEPVVQTLGHRVVKVVRGVAEGGAKGGGATSVLVRWPPYSRSPQASYSVVYVVMTKEADALFWTQVTQTVDLEARLGVSAVNQLGIRVLVVDPEGLVTVYSPSVGDEEGMSSTEPPLGSSPAPPGSQGGGDAVRGTGDENGDRGSRGAGHWPLVIREDVNSPLDSAQLALLFPTASAEAAATQLAARRLPAGAPWVLHEVSLIHQRVLVIAEVSWEARGWVYLVTWEVDGGGLKGNLFTQSTSVTLSLWPDTLYHIQVEVASGTPGDPRPSDRSQVLHLDTRRAAPVVLATEPSPPLAQRQETTPDDGGAPMRPKPPERPSAHELTEPAGEEESRAGGIGWVEGEVLAGSGAALALFILILLLLMARRCRGFDCQSCPDSIPKSKVTMSQPALREKDEKDTWREDGERDAFFYLFRPLSDALAWVGHGTRRDRQAAATVHPGALIPTVSGDQRQKGQRLQHPEPYSDAFLREVERGAGNEVQV